MGDNEMKEREKNEEKGIRMLRKKTTECHRGRGEIQEKTTECAIGMGDRMRKRREENEVTKG